MNNSFERIWLQQIPYRSKVDLYENLYLQAIIDSYQHIDKSIGKEEKIRDRFYYDLIYRNPLTKQWVDLEYLDIRFEKWKMNVEKSKSRVDLSFFWSGFGHFEIECKRLFQQESKNEAYLNEGLKRFIELKYAEKNNYAGMIGFVVSGDILNIKNKIQLGVNNFHSDNSFNKNTCLKWEHNFISYHKKVDDKKIKVYHLFFQFTE